MSALEQIRKRPGLIISILGLALVLFILTAVNNPEKIFSDPTTIAKVDGQKIDYTEFQKRQEDIRRQYEMRGYKNIDNAMIQEQAIQSLIEESLMNKELEAVGITVTGEELSKAMLGENIPMAVQQLYWQRQQQGLYSGRDLHELAFNSAQYQLDAETAAQFKEQWIELEQAVIEMLKQQKYQNLVLGLLVANDLDAKAQYEENNSSTEIRYAKVDVSTISDSDVEVSDADLKAQYEKDKALYTLDEDTYLLNYIVADVTPSDEDRLEATQAVENALIGLRSSTGVDTLSGNNKFVINRLNTAAKYLPSNISDKIESLAQDTVQQISFYDNKYTLAKYLGSSHVTDSITFDMIALADNADADSIMTLLNAGTALTDLPEGTVLQSQLDQRASLLNGNTQIAMLFGNANVNEYFNAVDFTQNPNFIFRLVKKDEPVVAYNVAEITYQLEPSTATINEIQSRLRAYVTNNSDATSFVDNAISSNYTALPATVTKNSLSVAGVPDTRSLAKWAANKAKKGQVSEVYSDDNRTVFFAGALTNVYEKGFTPLSDSQVSAQTRTKVARAKKAAKLIETYAGKGTSVDTYADAMGVKVDTTIVTFGQNYARGFMPGDGKLIALTSEAVAGQVNGPEATDYSVVVFEVIGKNEPTREFDAVNDASYFQQSQGAQPLLRNWSAIIRAGAKVDNKVQKFFQD